MTDTIATLVMSDATLVSGLGSPGTNQLETGTLPAFLAPPARAIAMVATADVGATAAAMLQEKRSASCAVTLAGPRDYAPDDVAAVLSRLLVRPIDVAVVPEAAWPAALAGAGFSPAALAGFSEMTRGLNGAHIDMASDPGAVARHGTTPLQHVLAALVGRRR